MFKEKFIRLCNERGEPPTVVCQKIGVTSSAFSKWTDQSVPRKATLMRIADYFGVSVSYLLGVTDDPDPVALIDPSKNEPPMLEWLTKLDDMTVDELAEVEQFVDFVLSRKK
jgi:transcriptional regulator with XRE-family HTH domain